MNDDERLVRVVKAISVTARVRILRLLKGRALCVNALVARMDLSQGAVSQHLRILREAELVCAEKRGAFVHYRRNEPALAKWRARIDALLDTDGPGPPAPGARRCAKGCGGKKS